MEETGLTNTTEVEIVENEALALALQTKVCFTNDEWNKLTVPNTIIPKSPIRVGDRLFKPVLEKRLPGQLGGASGIAGVSSVVHEFWAASDRREMPHFLDKLKRRGHRLIARWGEEMLLGEHGKQKSPWLIPEGERLQWQQVLESCQQWQPQTSRFGNVISWNLGPLFLSEAMP